MSEEKIPCLHARWHCTSITIDPNVRVKGNLTYSGFEDIEYCPNKPRLGVGDEVQAVEEESQQLWVANIREIDWKNKLVYLAIDWNSQ